MNYVNIIQFIVLVIPIGVIIVGIIVNIIRYFISFDRRLYNLEIQNKDYSKLVERVHNLELKNAANTSALNIILKGIEVSSSLFGGKRKK